jgi:hypothetical protein
MSSSDEEDNPTEHMLEDTHKDVEEGSKSIEHSVLVNTSDEEKKYCKHNIGRRKSIAICISMILVIVCIFFIIIFGYNSDSEGITARLKGGTYSKKTCVNFDYGCCEIYDQCKVVTTNGHEHMDYKTINLDVYVTYAHDSIKSNCVSLRDIVNHYNLVYGRDDCGKYGCCPSINIGCDDVLHYHINDGNNGGLVNKYLENRTTLMPIKVPKNNTEGTNCWNKGGFISGINHFTNKYEHGYPIPDDSWSFLPYILCIIGLWCLCASVMAKK